MIDPASAQATTATLTSGVGAPQATLHPLPADAAAFDQVLEGLTAAPARGPGELTTSLGQMNELISAAFDPSTLPALPPNATYVEAMQYTAALNGRLAMGQQTMTLMHGLSQKAEKAAEALLPKTG